MRTINLFVDHPDARLPERNFFGKVVNNCVSLLVDVIGSKKIKMSNIIQNMSQRVRPASSGSIQPVTKIFRIPK